MIDCVTFLQYRKLPHFTAIAVAQKPINYRIYRISLRNAVCGMGLSPVGGGND
jgi:hypothetical protein